MTTAQPNPQGWGYAGSFRSDQIPAAKSYPQQFIYVYDSGNGAYMYSDGVGWNQFGNNEFRFSHYKIGVIGASTTQRANAIYGCTNSTYSRTKVNGVGIGSIRTSTLDSVLNVGRKFRLTCDMVPQIEGTFTILTAAAEGGGTRITWVDDRDDFGPSSIPSPATVFYVDPQFYTIASGTFAHASFACGGKADPVIVAVGSTNIVDDWNLSPQLAYNRIDQLLAQGPFGAIHVGGGILGNALLANYGSEAIYTALVSLCKRLRGAAARVFVEEPTASRNVTANSGALLASAVQGQIFTAGNRLLRRMWRDLMVDCPNVQIVPVNSILVTSTVGTYGGAQADVDNAWPPVDIMNSDGTHMAYGASRLIGTAMGFTWNKQMQPWLPEVGVYPDNIWNATYADQGGLPNTNIHSNWFDVVPTIAANAPYTGLQPQGCSIAVANASGNMAGTSAVGVDPEGGYDWNLTLSDTGAGSALGLVITLQVAGYTGQELWRKLSINPGKTLDIYIPVYLADVIDNTWKAMEVQLMLDYGSGLKPHCGWSDLGLFRQGSIGPRAIDSGFNGVLHLPKTTVPLDAAGITNAVIQIVLTGFPNVGTGLYTNFGIGAGTRVDVY